MRAIVKELVSRNGKRKVEIFRHADGTFGFEVLEFSEEPLEMSWISTGRYSECHATDVRTAEAEARSRVDWLSEEGDG